MRAGAHVVANGGAVLPRLQAAPAQERAGVLCVAHEPGSGSKVDQTPRKTDQGEREREAREVFFKLNKSIHLRENTSTPILKAARKLNITLNCTN